MATEKQVNYLLSLAAKAGLSTRYMDAGWKRFATMRERQGTVRAFLESLDRRRASEMIDALK